MEMEKPSTRSMLSEAANIHENISEKKSTSPAPQIALTKMAAKSRSQNQTLGSEIKEASRACIFNHPRTPSR